MIGFKIGGFVFIPRGRKRPLIQAHQNELVEMREKGFSYQQMADWLALQGVVVSKDTVRLFILRVSREG